VRIPGYLIAWVVTLLVEVPCVAALYRGQRLKMGLVCAVATSATNLPMNLLLPHWLGTGLLFLLVGETAAVVLEAAVYFAVSRPRNLPLAMIASALANGLSFAAGLALPHP